MTRPSVTGTGSGEQLADPHAHLGKTHAILARCHGAATRVFLQRSARAIQDALEHHGISFEGKRLLVSLTPTILADAELRTVARDGARIRAALQDVITGFLAEHASGALDGPLHQFFAPYRTWWDLIASERRATEPIQLMRYDAVREDQGRWQILETNTCCPGGTIHCARVRTAWLGSPLGLEATRDTAITELAIDRADGFLRHFVSVAQVASGLEAPNLAICSYRGFYANELASLAAEHRRLVERRELPGGELVVCDARELTCDDGEVAYARGVPVAAIYNKLDPLMVDPSSDELAGWRAAVRSPRVELLNSLAAMYLTEAKRVLALLGDDAHRRALGLDAATAAAIDRLIPPSQVVVAGALAELHDSRHRFVLKADAYTRGAGVHVGKQLTGAAWAEAIESTIAAHGIAQRCADTPRRIALDPDAERELREEYWGVDLFYFGAQFAGAVSRSHGNMVFNIGNGGKESPVVVV